MQQIIKKQRNIESTSKKRHVSYEKRTNAAYTLN